MSLFYGNGLAESNGISFAEFQGQNMVKLTLAKLRGKSTSTPFMIAKSEKRKASEWCIEQVECRADLR
jgi:hypothetical protein